MTRGLRVHAGAAWVVVVCHALVSGPASAQSSGRGAEGTVLQVEKDDLVVDLGGVRGAHDGDVVELWRPLRIRHPITGKVLVDRFLIGKLHLVQVRPSLSLAQAQGELSRPAQTGDVVVLDRPAPPPTAAPPEPPPARPEAAPAAATPLDDDARALSKMFDDLHGTNPETRVRAYEGFAMQHPSSRYLQVLWEEARVLRRLLAGAEPAKPEGPTAQAEPFPAVVANEPLRVAIAVHGATGAVLHARTAGDDTYQSQPMQAVGADYYAATLPAGSVRAPAVEWFVEGVAADGTHPVLGDPVNPERAEVQDMRPAAPLKLFGQAAIWTDYASFDVRRADDYVWQTEGVIGGRLEDVGLRAVRTGFGVYRGVGGTLQQLDVLNQPGTPVGLTYGYLEGELGILPTFSIAARAILGLQADGVSGGASAFFRIGSDLATNMLFGGEVLGGIGLRGIAEFDWNSFRNWPIVLRSEVTNQPAGFDGDVGVRLIGQVGYRVLPHMVASLRASYQGRTIDHAGPGAGAAVGYSW